MLEDSDWKTYKMILCKYLDIKINYIIEILDDHIVLSLRNKL